MNENTTAPTSENEGEMSLGFTPTDPSAGTEPDTEPGTEPEAEPETEPETEPEAEPDTPPAADSEGGDGTDLPGILPPQTPGEIPEGEGSLPQTGETETGETEIGETQTGELVDAPGTEEKEGIDLATGILFGVAAVLAVAVAVLTVLLLKSRKKTAPAAAPQSDGTITVGKLHQQGDRESQQDCFAVSPGELISSRGLLAVVADGMGGLADGDKVSETAVAAMLDGFLSASGAPDDILLALTERANRQVNRLLGPANIGKSGSTLVAGLIREGKFHYISIGDSRICLFRDGQLIQLNREHIYRHELSIQALSGIGSLQGAAAHPKAAGLTSYLGMGQLKYVDIPACGIEIRSGDKFILMSDGVYNALSESEIAGALTENAEKAAELIGELIARKAYRNQDNYTAVILAP